MQARTAQHRKGRWLLLVTAVVIAHGWVGQEIAQRLPGLEGSDDAVDIKRMDVAFVRALEQQTPPETAPLAPPPSRTNASRAISVATAASAPARKASKPSAPSKPAPRAVPPVVATETKPAETEVVAETTPAKPDEPRAETAVAASAAVADRAPPTEDTFSTVATAPAPAPWASAAQERSNKAASFEWPASTRLTYSLIGNYRGEIEGSARVQWIREGDRYQVHMDVAVGPEFAPLMARRMTSDGLLGEAGLMPQRYQEETRVGFSTRRNGVQVQGDRVVLGNGQERALPEGMQDSASQFVQMSFIFTMDPSKLKPGTAITIPVALPRRVDNWIYDVLAEETLDTPVGAIKAFHVKPRREVVRPGELVAQAWFAPSMQYLPIRILIHQDAETFVDLLLSAAPKQAVGNVSTVR